MLFDPLGFGPTEWARRPGRRTRAASGLRLLPRDIVKIGQLVLAGGAWDGKPGRARRLGEARDDAGGGDPGSAAATAITGTSAPSGHGAAPLHWFGGIGWGGQYLFVMPARDLVVVIHCGNYQRSGREQTEVMLALMKDVVLPGFA